MSEDTFLQFAWMIIFITMFTAFLVIGAVIFQYLERSEHREFQRLMRSKERWAGLVNNKQE